jgi:hypothetical protein
MRYAAWVAQVTLGLVLVASLVTGGCAGGAPAGAVTATPPAPEERSHDLSEGELPPGEQANPARATPLFRLAPYCAPTSTPTPTPTAVPRSKPLVWIGGEGTLTALGPAGWQTFPVPGIVHDIAVDPQGNAILAPGLLMCDGGLVRPLLPAAPGGEQDAVTIDPQGRIWAGYYGGIAVLEGGHWRIISIAEAGLPDPARVVRDMACDAQGVIWVATGGGLARYDGQTWQLYSAGTGLGADAAECVMVDPYGSVWVAHEKGVSVLRGTIWQHYPLDVIGFVQAMTVDSGGRVLAGTLYHGVALCEGEVWSTFASLGAGLASERVRALATDAGGRVFAGTRFGLSVYDGQRWTTYQEANSGLGDNQVEALAVAPEALGELPAPMPEQYGQLTGVVTWGGQPLGGVRVVLCSELAVSQGFGDNPCGDTPLSRMTRTSADGRYGFEHVPVGHYAVAAEPSPGHWVTRTRVLSAVRYPVRAGETTDVEPIEGSP